MNTFSAEFGARLKEERERKGMNQADFAALGGVGKLAQLRYEKGDRSPSAEYLDLIAGHGVDVGYLLTGRAAGRGGIDTELLSACISAVEASFDAAGFIISSAEERARFVALLYYSIEKAPGARGEILALCDAMVSAWVLAMDKKPG